ncbi:MAG: hypothetical protein K2F73_06940 [Ruminococcus sp.]|nr:hypothetical protein [Ruminococcus sp.]
MNMWENINIDNEKNNILKDEVYKNSCRITLEKYPQRYEITCGIYGAMVHTVYCGSNCQEIYNSMKQELQDFIDLNTTADEEYEFYNYFTNKY